MAGWLQSVSQTGYAMAYRAFAEGDTVYADRIGEIAAGQAVLEAAGGRVEDLQGQPLRYGKPGFENPDFLAWGQPTDAAAAKS